MAATAPPTGGGGLTVPEVRGSGRYQRRRSRKGAARLPSVKRYYRHETNPPPAGLYDFRVLLLRPKEKPRRINITDAVESLDWEDSSAVKTGTLIARRPDPEKHRSLPIERGHRILLSYRKGRKWKKIWEMPVDGKPSVDGLYGTVTASLSDDLDALRRSVREWEFRKTEARPNGWRADEIAEKVCRELNVPTGRIARGKDRLPGKIEGKMSGLEVIKKAYAAEREETGIRYVIRIRNGEVDVVPFERGPVLFEIDGIGEDLFFEAESKKEKPRTVLTATGRVDDEKVEIEVSRDRLRRRFGSVPWEENFGRVKSREKLRELAARKLAKEVAVKNTATTTIPGIPDIERGTAIELKTHEPDWNGPGFSTRNRGYCYVQSATHSLTPQRYTTNVTLVQHDPYLADRRRRDQERREKKREEREGKKDEKKDDDGS